MLRLTGGEFRGRMIHTPEGEKTRPTQAKLRQALFNSLQLYLDDARVLDLFAGSGSLGFEALSRGAQRVVFVESARPITKLLEKNIATLGVADKVRVLNGSVDVVDKMLFATEAAGGPFDIILADPPYSDGWEEKLLQTFPWEKWLRPGGHFCIEWGSQKSRVQELPDSLGCLVKVREKNYGDSNLTTYIHQKA